MAKLAINGGTSMRQKPFSRWPDWDQKDEQAILSVMKQGSWGGYPSPNKYAAEFAAAFAQFSGAKYGVCNVNGSVAIELAIWAAGIEPGSEIIVPAYTFIATASAAIFCHTIPVFVDIDPQTYCIDPAKIKEAITSKTKAIVPVHLACNMADMDEIMKIAKEHNLVVIEDCAHAHGARWQGQGAGSIGSMGTFSFQTSKLLTAGEGGITLTNDSLLEKKLQSLVNCGRKESTYEEFPGSMLGKNYRISEWSAGLLISQLARMEEQTNRRITTTQYLEKKLCGMSGISFTKQNPKNDRRAIYQFIVKYNPQAFKNVHRDRFIAALNAEGIPAEGEFYVPLYKDELMVMDQKTNPLAFLDYAKDFSLEKFNCPIAEKAAYQEAIWLPHQLFLGSKEDMDDIINAFDKIKENIEELL